mgnify:FL=1
MDKNKQAALARALEQIEKLPKSEVRADEPFRARYRRSAVEIAGYYRSSDYLPYRDGYCILR